MNFETGYRQVSLVLLELLSVFLAATITSQIPNSDLSRSGIFIILMVHFFAFYLSRMDYEFENRGFIKEFEKTFWYSLVFGVLLTVFSFFLEDNFEFSRRGLIYFTLLNSVFIYLINCFIRQFKHVLLFTSNINRKTVLITTEERWSGMKKLLKTEQAFKNNLVALVILDSKKDYFGISIPFFKTEEEAIEFATREVVDQVFINLPSEHYDLKQIVSEFEILGIDVSVDVNSFGFRALKNKKIQQFSDHSIVTFSTNFYKPSHIFMKRFLDIMGAIVGLLLCGLVSIILVPLIRKDGGPAIFVQKRVGTNGRVFKFYKFRSMYIDAEERKKELMAQNQMHGGMFKMDNDPRITPIGHFIRKTSLDELPQFYNVLTGDMSLVGTRPPTVDEFDQYTPSQKRRLSFKPGITGLWQVSGRSNITDFDEVVKLDVEYIDNWTIWSDVKILLKTVKVVIKGEGSK
ncbi:TPA: sugar transferase [Streptococcus suis]